MVVVLYCAVQLVCNICAVIIGEVFDTNYWVYQLNTILSFAIILALFARHLMPIKTKWQIMFIMALYAVSFLPIMSGDGITTFNSYSSAFCSLIIVAYCLYFFYTKLLKSPPEEHPLSNAVFWCVIGLFTYYAGAFFIFISYKILIIEISGSAVGRLWQFQNLLLFICCLYISYGVLCKNYQKISLSY